MEGGVNAAETATENDDSLLAGFTIDSHNHGVSLGYRSFAGPYERSAALDLAFVVTVSRWTTVELD